MCPAYNSGSLVNDNTYYQEYNYDRERVSNVGILCIRCTVCLRSILSSLSYTLGIIIHSWYYFITMLANSQRSLTTYCTAVRTCKKGVFDSKWNCKLSNSPEQVMLPYIYLKTWQHITWQHISLNLECCNFHNAHNLVCTVTIISPSLTLTHSTRLFPDVSKMWWRITMGYRKTIEIRTRIASRNSCNTVRKTGYIMTIIMYVVTRINMRYMY